MLLATSALVLALWSVSYNLLLGYTGMVSFAHAAFYGIGAYTVALLSVKAHVPLVVGLLLSPVIAALLSLVTGLVALRAVRLYFSLLTLALAQLFFVIAFEWYGFTGGDNGVHGLRVPDFLTDSQTLYFFVLAVVVFCLILMFILVRSPFGAALSAIRENRQRAASVGIYVKAYELAAFTVAGMFAGVAGGLYAIFDQQAYPQLLFWTASAQPVVVTLLGGTGSFLGPAIGAAAYTGLANVIGKHLPYQFDVVLGALVLFIVLAAPGGLASLPALATRSFHRLRGERAPLETVSAGEAIGSMDVDRALQAEAAVASAPGSGKALLKLEGLSKAFGGLRAVDGVSLEVLQGDRHAIIGPNGAGKSTLFNLITGRLRPDHGKVIFDDLNVTGHAPHRLARSGLGRAFQVTSIFPRLTVRANVQYAMLAQHGLTVRPWGRADRMFRTQATELLESVGLGRYVELPAANLSHGDQRALELALSLALGSRLLLLDEPTAGMSPYETRKAMELVRRLVTELGLTLLFCEHDMEVVFGTAHTVTVMHQGRVLAEGSPEAVRANPEVQRVYLGEPANA
jgi:ABC-type branched-subunit amino acid transport system ATPase component/ABC-type branched-subunit amino acid transport system permease subunit